jgi:hypothetical protein
VVSHNDVVDALAEHLVLAYINNFHSDEIAALRNETSPSVLKRVLSGLISCLRELVFEKGIRLLCKGSLYAAASLGAISLHNPQAGVFVVQTLWRALQGFLLLTAFM